MFEVLIRTLETSLFHSFNMEKKIKGNSLISRSGFISVEIFQIDQKLVIRQAIDLRK